MHLQASKRNATWDYVHNPIYRCEENFHLVWLHMVRIISPHLTLTCVVNLLSQLLAPSVFSTLVVKVKQASSEFLLNHLYCESVVIFFILVL